ncbi:family 1 glycosylhydrolase, partial [Novosphingobium sp. 9U]|uniref:family 1 glycosylhydrolase n=1 Tax=Novosphingobium sp. 9U TaxID=2653158 RepID=UPI00135BD52E
QEQAPSLFARFCGRAAKHLASGIGYALTLNEPNLIGMLPMLLPKDSGARLLAEDKLMSQAVAKSMNVPLYLSGNGLFLPDAAVVQANLIAGHKAAREAMKAARPDLPVGVSLAMNDDQAVGAASMRDSIRARLYDPWLEAARADDFIGVQNYWRAVWDASHRLPAPPGVVTDENGSELYAPSLANAARYAHSKCGVPVVVTEHGCNVLDDAKRAKFIPAALAELRKAMDEGLPVRGYTHWSLIDNYEWFFGYKPRYGLHSLDRTTFARTPKPSAAVLGDIARRNSL